MKRKHKRLVAVLSLLSCAGAGVAIILTSLQDNMVFFYTPKEITDQLADSGKSIRVGGLVKEGSVEELEDGTLFFTITDLTAEQDVTYKGLVPSLFREGQGVVAEGRFSEDGTLTAKTILAKHDEKYMPPQVKEALQESGEWRGDDASPTTMQPEQPLP